MLQELFKIAFLVVTAPIWLPFVRAMWRELRDLTEEDGGLFGEEPSPRQKAEIRAARAARPSPVVHEWIALQRPEATPGGERPRGPSGPASAPAGPRATRGPAGPGPRRTFR